MGIHITLGFLLDLLWGDPPRFPHPVRWIGRMISFLEGNIRKLKLSPFGLRTAGVVLVLLTVGTAYLATFLLLYVASQVSNLLFDALSIMIIYFSLASRCLAQEAGEISKALADEDLVLARKRLSYIVGRDTQDLTEEEVVRGAVETVAENTVDGVISPLFYIFLGGPALGMAYKAVNTLDSMVGYFNDKYRDLGWASARLDDFANWLPARFTGLLMPLAGIFGGYNIRRGYRIMWRDRRNHKSPNGGYPEAAMAGLLGVRIGGTNYYFGSPVEKPTIGDPENPLERAHVGDAVRIMITTAVLALIILFFCGLIVNSWREL